MIKFFLLLLFFLSLNGEETIPKVDKSKLINCYEIFEQRRSELEYQVEKIEDEKQAFQALKDATMNIIDKKQKKLEAKQKEINSTLAEINGRLAEINSTKLEIEKMLEENKKILKAIKEAQSGKLVTTYSKMRAGNAAKILQDMDENDSLSILSKLSPKVLSKIFSKMDSKKAAVLSQKLLNYKPKTNN